MVLVNEISCAMCEKLGWNLWGWHKKGALIWRVFIKGRVFCFLLDPFNLQHFHPFCFCYYFFCVPQDKIIGSEDEPSTKKSEMCSDEAKLKWMLKGWSKQAAERYKNKKYCARKVLIVFFSFCSTIFRLFYVLSIPLSKDWGLELLDS